MSGEVVILDLWPDDPDLSDPTSLAFAAYCEDEDWFREHGMCGGCGNSPAPDAKIRCVCTDCGCYELHGGSDAS